MFRIFKDRHQATAGRPISRIAKQLNASDTVIESELWIWGKSAVGVWDWIVWARIEIKNLGRNLANREMFDYFTGANIAKPRKLKQVIVNHCMAIECIAKLETSVSEVPQDEFGKVLGRMDE